MDNATQTVLAKAQVPNNNDALRNAQFIRARVVWGSEQRPVVPVVAVSRIGGLYFAFVAESDSKGGYVVHQKALQVGQIVGNDYVVLDGIKPGDKVVVTGTQFLIDGIPVDSRKKAKRSFNRKCGFKPVAASSGRARLQPCHPTQ